MNLKHIRISFQKLFVFYVKVYLSDITFTKSEIFSYENTIQLCYNFTVLHRKEFK